MAIGRKKKKDNSFEGKKVRLHVITRHELEDGTFEYHDTISEPMLRKDLPVHAVPLTGTKSDYALVDMEPNLPDYCGEVERGRDGRIQGKHNFFDAGGYYIYAIDNRMKEAEEAATARMKRVSETDWKKIITIVACAVVVVLVVWRFLS